MNKDFKQFLKSAANVKPSARQIEWFDTEFYAFVHFTVNTYTDLEWGHGDESPSIFNPVELDCDEWVEAVKSAGMKGLILTAKHHDGFCLWPSKYTEHCVKNSPYKDGKGDIVREAAEACKRGGIKFGVYLSPWDRNSQYYGTPEYNDYYSNQLTELLTGYGDLFMIWQDNACGEGPNGKRQIYDFDRFNSLIRKYQPNACIFNDFGPDVRWCGNESGTSRQAEWAVLPSELCFRSEKQTSEAFLDGELKYMNNWDQDLGALSNIMYSKGLVFTGSEIDMSIRPGWFYHENEEPHSLDRLVNTYINSVGANASFNLNVPPMPNGRFNPKDIERLKELGIALKNIFGNKLESKWQKTDISDGGQCVLDITLDNEQDIKYLVLAEDFTQGQRVESFKVVINDKDVYSGFCIGHKKIVKLHAKTNNIKVIITAARDEVIMREISLY
jgi:Alpha-L-fucosidase